VKTHTSERVRSFTAVTAVTAIVAVGTAVAVVSAIAWTASVSSQRRHDLAATTAGVRFAINLAVDRSTNVVDIVDALVQARPNLTNAELEAELGVVDIGANYPGSLAFAYVERVRPSALESYRRAVANDPPLGIPQIFLDPTGTVASSSDSDLCLTRLTVSEPGRHLAVLNQNLLPRVTTYLSPAFNWCGRQSMARLASSISSGDPLVLSAGSLLNRYGVTAHATAAARAAWRSLFLIINPVYQSESSLKTPAEHRRAFSGFAVGVFSAAEIVSSATTTAEHASVLIGYATKPFPAAVLYETGLDPPTTRGFTAASRSDDQWIVRVNLGSHSGAMSPLDEGLVVLAVGLVITALLAVLVTVLVRSRRSALVQVDQRTSELRYQALHDALTGLPNRLLIGDRARDLVERATSERTTVAVLFIDLDDFKMVNDTLGHRAGDELLIELAERLRAALPPSATIGRLGGDEFVVVHAGGSNENLVQLATDLQNAIHEPFRLGVDGRSLFTMSASIGIATGVNSDSDALFRDADIALYRAKELGKGCHVMFRAEMHEAAQHKLALELELRQAFEQRQFLLLYQPIVDLRTGKIKGLEALLRWRHPTRGIVSPAEFIGVLEASELIIDVGRFVLHEACRQARAWHEAGHQVEISVNVAARQLRYDSLLDDVREACDDAAFDAQSLVLEVTESMLLLDTEGTARRLRALKALGIRIAIDDFGTGYSSLSYLREFPVDILKIDQSFVAQVDEDGGFFLDALVHLGRALGLSTVAEGIERRSQLAHLQYEQCDSGQGFLLSKPLTAEAATMLLGKSRSLFADLLPGPLTRARGRS